MPRAIEIPDVGVVEFPDSMNDSEMELVARRLHLDAMNKKPISSRGMTGETGSEASLKAAYSLARHFPGAVADTVMAPVNLAKDFLYNSMNTETGGPLMSVARGVGQTASDLASGDPERSGAAGAQLAAAVAVPAAVKYAPQIARGAGAVVKNAPTAYQIVRHPLRSAVRAGINAITDELNAPVEAISGPDALEAVSKAAGRPIGAKYATEAAKLVQQGMNPDEAVAKVVPRRPAATAVERQAAAQASPPEAPPTAPPSPDLAPVGEEAAYNATQPAPQAPPDPMASVYGNVMAKQNAYKTGGSPPLPPKGPAIAIEGTRPVSAGEAVRSLRTAAPKLKVSGLTADELNAGIEMVKRGVPAEQVLESIKAQRALIHSGSFVNLPNGMQVEASSYFPKGMRGKSVSPK